MSNFDQAMKEAKRIAATPQGQKLFQMLQQQNSQEVQSLLQQAAAGDIEQAKQTLSALLNNPEARKLLESLGGGNGE